MSDPAIMVIPVTLALTILFLRSLFWVQRDDRRRIKHGGLAALFIVVIGWPLSLLWWRWLRPLRKDVS